MLPFSSSVNKPEDKSARFLHSVDTARSDTLSSSVWSILPDATKTEMTTLPVDRTAGLAITDVAAAAYGQNPYYSGSYAAAGYGMYGSNPTATYYQQMANGLRAQNAAAATFPYGIGTATSAYYGTSYPTNFDYSTYNSPYYNGMRSSYYNPLAAGTTAYNAASLTTDTPSDLATTFLGKNEKKSKSSKKKKTGSCSPGDTQFNRVFIWDLNDICTVSTESLSIAHGKAPHVARAALLLKNLTNRIMQLAFPGEQLEECEMCNVDEVAQEDSLADGSLVDGRGGVELIRRIASKYMALKQLYAEYASKSETGYNYELAERCALNMNVSKEEVLDSICQIEDLYMRRTEMARRCLGIVTARSTTNRGYGNVVIGADGLVAAVSQVLLSGLASTVPIENIFSTAKIGKEAVLDRIQNRFGKKCSYIVVTSNPATMELSKKEGIPVWPTTQGSDDLERLLNAQTNFLLGNQH